MAGRTRTARPAGAVDPRHVAVGEEPAPARLQPGDADHRQLGEGLAVDTSAFDDDRRPAAHRLESPHRLGVRFTATAPRRRRPEPAAVPGGGGAVTATGGGAGAGTGAGAGAEVGERNGERCHRDGRGHGTSVDGAAAVAVAVPPARSLARRTVAPPNPSRRRGRRRTLPSPRPWRSWRAAPAGPSAEQVQSSPDPCPLLSPPPPLPEPLLSSSPPLPDPLLPPSSPPPDPLSS